MTCFLNQFHGLIFMSSKKEHQKIYKKIPKFECLPGCTDCCGPVPVSPYEADQLGIPGKRITPTHPGTLKCIFSDQNGCTVYDKRPMICRLFGTADHHMLRCPHGCKPQKLLTSKKAARMCKQHYKLIVKQS